MVNLSPIEDLRSSEDPTGQGCAAALAAEGFDAPAAPAAEIHANAFHGQGLGGSGQVGNAHKGAAHSMPPGYWLRRSRYREIARRILLAEPPPVIAKRMGINLHTLYDMMKDPEYDEQINALQERLDEVAVDLKRTAILASYDMLNNIIELANCAQRESVRLSASQDILDRIGFAAPKQIAVRNTLELGDRAAAALNAAFREAEAVGA